MPARRSRYVRRRPRVVRKSRPSRSSFRRRPRRSRFARGNASTSCVYMKMRYQISSSLAAGAAAYQYAHFRLNSINDPMYAAGGGKPSGYTVAATRYQKYRVLGAKVDCTFTAKEATMPVNVGFYAADYSTYHHVNSASTVADQLKEGWNSRYAVLDGLDIPQGRHKARLTRYFSIKKIVGPASVIAQGDIAINDDPDDVDLASLTVCCGSADESTVGADVRFDMIITYYVKLTGRHYDIDA